MKKALALLLACLLMVSVFAACGQEESSSSSAASTSSAAETSEESAGESEESAAEESSEETSSEAATGETVTFNFVVPGDEPQDYDRGIADVNEKLAADGVGIEVEMTYIPWDVWDQRINLMLSTGENFDCFQVMSDRVTLTSYASRGALADITDAMEQYGENIVANTPELGMTNCQVGGVQYGIPAYWLEPVLREATIRQDLLDANNLEMPTSFEELTEAYQVVMDNWTGDGTPYFCRMANDDKRAYFFAPSDPNFVLYEDVVYVNQDGTIMNYYETEAFEESCRNAKEWYDRGFINPDILTLTSDQVSNQRELGNWFVDDGTPGSITLMAQNVPGLEPDDIVWYNYIGDADPIRPYGTKNLNAVPLASEHPEAAVKFFNWLYASQENYDLFCYGTEGVDYELGEDHTYTTILDPETNQVPFSVATWMVGNLNYSYWDATVPPDQNQHLNVVDETAVDGIAANLTFDASPVQTQLADVQTVISSTLLPMAWGITDYDSGIDAALEQLKAAGVDDVIAEFQKQLEAIQ